MATLANLALKALQDCQVVQGYPVYRVDLVLMEILGFLVKKDFQGFQDLKVPLDQLAEMHRRANRECEVNLVIPFLAPLADQDCQDVTDCLDQRVTEDSRVLLVPLETLLTKLLDLLDLGDRQEPGVLVASRDKQDCLVNPARKVTLVQHVHSVFLESRD